MKLERMWKVLDWLAELPRAGYGIWRPAEMMSPAEYGAKLLLGIVSIAVGIAIAAITILMSIAIVVGLVVCCPAVAIAVVSIFILAVGLGWLRKKVQSK